MIDILARTTEYIYRSALRPSLFRVDAEKVHDSFLNIGERLGAWRWPLWMLNRAYAFRDPSLEQTIHGIAFVNPIGLAAGFDKNGRIVDAVDAIGFGHTEIGSVTGNPCAGNSRPRLWRLPKSQSLHVHYGLANDGAMAVATRLRAQPHRIPVGVSVAKTNDPSTVERSAGIADYIKAISASIDVASYITINISCPSAFGGEPFTSPESLHKLLAAVDALTLTKPVFLKMPSDLTVDVFDSLVDVAAAHHIKGLIIGNLTKDRKNPRLIGHEISHAPACGGFSGKPLVDRVNKLIAHTAQKYKGRFTIIGCGGVFTSEDAYEKIRLGASLIQLITGMVYDGPSAIGRINAGLVDLLRRDGFTNIREAVGTGL